MSTIRLQALPRFPASVEAGDGIVVTRSGGVFTFALDPNHAIAEPLTALIVGQSFVSLSPAFPSAAQPNALIWNNEMDDFDAVGDAFIPPQTDIINLRIKVANELAKRYPLRQVRVISLGFSGAPIARFIDGADPDGMGAVRDVVNAALVNAGLEKIDYFIWVQGPGDITDPLGDLTQYVARHATVIAQFRAESWFPYETPIVICGFAPAAITGDPESDDVNLYLRKVVSRDANRRRFVRVDDYPLGFWDADPGHLNAEGFNALGRALADALEGGPGETPNHNVIVDPLTGRVRFGGIVKSDAHAVISRNITAEVDTPLPTGTDLHLLGSDASNNRLVITTFGSGVFSAASLRRARGTHASPTALQADDVIATFGGMPYYGGSSPGWRTTHNGQLNVHAAENQTDTNQGTYIDIYTTPIGSTTPAIALRIKDDKTIRAFGYGAGTLITDASGNIAANTTTGAGNSVRATAPTLVTPVIGAATGTSLALGGSLTGGTLSTAGAGVNSIIHTLQTDGASSTTGASGAEFTSNSADLILLARGTAGTATRYGVTSGGYNEISAAAGNGLLLGTVNSTPVIVGTNNTARLTISGAGATTIKTQLDVLNNSSVGNGSSADALTITAQDAGVAQVNLNGYGNYCHVIGHRASGTQASKTALLADEIISLFGAGGYDTNTTTYATQASFQMKAGGNWASGSRPTYISVITTNAGSTTNREVARFRGDAGFTVAPSIAIPAGGTQNLGCMFSSTASFGVFFGSGAPSLSAAKGSLYLRSDGSTTNNRAYINTDGGTTWTALTTAA